MCAHVASDVIMFEELAVADDGDQDMAPVASKGTSDDKPDSSSLEEVQAKKAAEMPSTPDDVARRAALGEATNTTGQPPATRSSTDPPSCEVVTSEDSEDLSELLEAPTVDLLKQWAAQAFTDPSGVARARPADFLLPLRACRSLAVT